MKSLKGQFFLKMLEKSKYGTLHIEFPDGKKSTCGEGQPEIQVQIRSWEVLDLLFSRGDLGLAEAIIKGEMIVDDATALVEWACRNDQDLGRTIYGSWYGTLVDRIRRWMLRYDAKSSQGQIMAHYDLGNEFYRLWLDRTMTYSSALFASQDQALDEAQINKYDRIIDSLNIRPGDRVLEIGAGWGGFFSRVVERTGCHVTAVMNSPAQAKHNRLQIENAKMKDHVEVVQTDYRNISGQFDKVVSIEMIEAVGENQWDAYFSKIRASLKDKGSVMIQGITIREDLFHSYRKGTDFIQKYVFPGGMLLPQSEFKKQSQERRMHLTDSLEFPQSYAETLKQWRQKFDEVTDSVKAQGFDESFIRLWKLYLCYCEGAFRAGRISVGQYLIQG